MKRIRCLVEYMQLSNSDRDEWESSMIDRLHAILRTVLVLIALSCCCGSGLAQDAPPPRHDHAAA